MLLGVRHTAEELHAPSEPSAECCQKGARASNEGVLHLRQGRKRLQQRGRVVGCRQLCYKRRGRRRRLVVPAGLLRRLLRGVVRRQQVLRRKVWRRRPQPAVGISAWSLRRCSEPWCAAVF